MEEEKGIRLLMEESKDIIKNFPFNIIDDILKRKHIFFEQIPKFRKARKQMVKEHQKLKQFNKALGMKYILLRDLFVTLLQPAEETMSMLNLVYGIYQDSKEEMEKANENKKGND